MSAVMLARIQFAVTVGFHFLFPPLTLGLSFIIFILETLYLKKNEEIYKEISTFLIKILAVIFAVGVATGITMEFSFGTNWSNYSRMVGDIFGAPLAAEAVFAFFMESIFLGILVFGRNRVSKKLYWWSSFFVFFGSHLSGLWIIIANSWMQTPAGYKIENGRAVLTNFFEAALNPSTVIRYVHTVTAAWVTGSLFAAGIAAWFLLKEKFTEHAKRMLKVAFTLFVIGAFLEIGWGHAHSVNVAEHQPVKLAAFEGLWETTKGAPLSIFGIPDEEKEETHFHIRIPKLLSFLIAFDTNHEVKGLKEFKKEDRPPVFVSYMSYHLMVLFGFYFALIAIWGMFLFKGGKIYKNKLFLKILLFSIPIPLLVNEFGWIAAEVGRQPWAVYGVLRTSDAVSVVVPAWQVLVTLILFTLVYAAFFVIALKIILKIIKKGFVGEIKGY